jgi:hypothetical protein
MSDRRRSMVMLAYATRVWCLKSMAISPIGKPGSGSAKDLKRLSIRRALL